MKTRTVSVIVVALVIVMALGVTTAVAGTQSRTAAQSGEPTCTPEMAWQGDEAAGDGAPETEQPRVRTREQLRVNENVDPACDECRSRSQERVNEAPAPDDSDEPTGSIEPTPTVEPTSTVEPTATVAAVSADTTLLGRVSTAVADGLVTWFRTMLGYLGFA